MTTGAGELKHAFSVIPHDATVSDFKINSMTKLAPALYWETQPGGELRMAIPEVGSLYHYSPLAGARSIIDSASIWATDTRYLNDSHELVEATKVFEKMFPSTPRSSSPADKFAHSILDLVRQNDDFYTSPNAARVYLACFCGEDDVLSVWRGYGGDTLAYSLGFSRESVSSLRINGKERIPSARLLRMTGDVVYGGGSHDLLMRTFIDEMMDRLASVYADPLAEGSEKDLAATVRQIMVPLDVFIKNSSFQDEREYRFAVVDMGGNLETKMRETRFGMARYVELRSPAGTDNPFMVESVTQGPTQWPTLAQEGMEAWLNMQATLIPDNHFVKTTGSSYR